MICITLLNTFFVNTSQRLYLFTGQKASSKTKKLLESTISPKFYLKNAIKTEALALSPARDTRLPHRNSGKNTDSFLRFAVIFPSMT